MDHSPHKSGTAAHRNHNDDGASNSSHSSVGGEPTFLSDSSDFGDAEEGRSRTHIKKRRTIRRKRKSLPSWWEYLIMGVTKRRGTLLDVVDEPLLVIEKDFSTGSANGIQNGLLAPPSTKRKASSMKRRRKWYTYLVFTSISGLTILAILLALNLVLLLTTLLLYPLHTPPPPLDITANPFTKGVTPLACHSHNDYWRSIPLFSALHAGCISTEADVWLLPSSSSLGDGKLYVGHNRRSLTPDRTFQSLYVQPLVKLLSLANTPLSNSSETNLEAVGGEWNGVFDMQPTQSLALLIDVKTNGPMTWPLVLQELEPLRSRGWLTFVDHQGVVHPRPITIVGTGETPFNLLLASNTSTGVRDTFFDAPLDLLWTPLPIDTPLSEDDIQESSLPTPQTPKINEGQGMVGISLSSNFTQQNSYYASVSYKKAVGRPWRGKVTREQLKIIRGHVRGARERGLKVRYWGVPSWPGWMRRVVWDVLRKEGVDVLGVDELGLLGEFGG